MVRLCVFGDLLTSPQTTTNFVLRYATQMSDAVKVVAITFVLRDSVADAYSGFGRSLSGLASMTPVWTIDRRYHFRLCTSALSLHSSSFALVVSVGLFALLKHLWLANGSLVPVSTSSVAHGLCAFAAAGVGYVVFEAGHNEDMLAWMVVPLIVNGVLYAGRNTFPGREITRQKANAVVGQGAAYGIAMWLL